MFTAKALGIRIMVYLQYDGEGIIIHSNQNSRCNKKSMHPPMFTHRILFTLPYISPMQRRRWKLLTVLKYCVFFSSHATVISDIVIRSTRDQRTRHVCQCDSHNHCSYSRPKTSHEIEKWLRIHVPEKKAIEQPQPSPTHL